MLVINYNGNKPTTDYYKFSVQGNNKADVIRFLVQLNQGGLSFDENYHFYAKVQCVDDDFYDKVELDNFEFSDSENLLKANFKLESKHTSHKQIEVSLSCEDLRTSKKIVWQTQIVKVAISNGVNADEEIANLYPTILEQLQEQIDELKEGGGGGGSSANDVAIRRVWLSYDKKEARCRINTLVDRQTALFATNDPNKMYVNIETTPINSKVEKAIQDGLFVIRFDYPLRKKRSPLLFDEEDYDNYVAFDKRYQDPSTHNSGAGYRSFARSLWHKSQTTYTKIKKYDAILNSLIFVNENNVVETEYGDKHIYIKMTFYDFVKKFYTAKNATFIDNVPQSFLLNFENYYVAGLPMAERSNTTENKKKHFNSGYPVAEYYGGFRPQRISGQKYLPCYTGYSYIPMELPNGQIFVDDAYYYLYDNPFMLDKKGVCYYSKIFQYSQTQPKYQRFRVANYKQKFVDDFDDSVITALKARCCILKEDYLTNRGDMWLKKFSQGKQSIRLFCKGGITTYDVDDSRVLLAFRIQISRE